jgi:hypothetical protein
MRRRHCVREALCMGVLQPNTRSGRHDTVGEVVCPICRLPATIVDQFVLYSAAGPVLHVRTACTGPHHFRSSQADDAHGGAQ